jgi:hypothetical protein
MLQASYKVDICQQALLRKLLAEEIKHINGSSSTLLQPKAPLRDCPEPGGMAIK